MTDTRTAFLDLADWAADTSPLYERLCRIVADDPELLDLARAVDGDWQTDRLATFQAHGEWIEWHGAEDRRDSGSR